MPDNSAPLIWRAGGGYQLAPQLPAPPPAPTAPTPAVRPIMLCYPRVPPLPWFCPPYQWPVCPPYPPLCPPYPVAGAVEGPIPVAGLCVPPPPYGRLSPPPAPLAVPPAPKKDEKKSEEGKNEKEQSVDTEKKDDKAADKKEEGEAETKEKEEAAGPPSKLADNVNYMYDSDHTMVHIFKKAAPVWTEKYRTETLKFKIFEVSVNFSVKMIIEIVVCYKPKNCNCDKGGQCKKADELERSERCKGWAVTEVIERGSGGWDKGTTIEYESDTSKGTLKSMGWSQKRGDSLPPVWLVVHKTDFS